jgi:hypothetical protein
MIKSSCSPSVCVCPTYLANSYRASISGDPSKVLTRIIIKDTKGTVTNARMSSLWRKLLECSTTTLLFYHPPLMFFHLVLAIFLIDFHDWLLGNADGAVDANGAVLLFCTSLHPLLPCVSSSSYIKTILSKINGTGEFRRG